MNKTIEKITQTKPNRRTVWLMFILGASLGMWFTYVALDPDYLLQGIADRVCTNYIISQNKKPHSYNEVVDDMNTLLYQEDEEIEVSTGGVEGE